MADPIIRFIFKAKDEISQELKKASAETATSTQKMQLAFTKLGEVAKIAAGNIIANLASSAVQALRGAAASIVSTVQETTTSLDSLGKAAERLGTSANELVAFQRAADFSGVGADQAVRALNQLQRAIGDATGGSAELVKAFDRIGVSVEDLIGLDIVDQFEAVAAGLDATTDATTKASSAQKLLGETLGFTNTITSGFSEALAAAREEVRGSGVDYDSAAERAAALVDAQTRLSDTVENLTVQVVEQLTPAITAVTDDVEAFLSSLDTKDVEEFARAVLELAGFLADFLGAALTLIRYSSLLDDVFGFSDELEGAEEALDRLQDRIRSFTKEGATTNKEYFDSWRRAAEELGYTEEQTKNLTAAKLQQIKALVVINERTAEQVGLQRQAADAARAEADAQKRLAVELARQVEGRQQEADRILEDLTFDRLSRVEQLETLIRRTKDRAERDIAEVRELFATGVFDETQLRAALSDILTLSDAKVADLQAQIAAAVTPTEETVEAVGGQVEGILLSIVDDLRVVTELALADMEREAEAARQRLSDAQRTLERESVRAFGGGFELERYDARVEAEQRINELLAEREAGQITELEFRDRVAEALQRQVDLEKQITNEERIQRRAEAREESRARRIEDANAALEEQVDVLGSLQLAGANLAIQFGGVNNAIERTVTQLGSAVVHEFVDSLTAIATGATDAEDALEEFGRSLLRMLTEVAIQLTVMIGLALLLRALGFGNLLGNVAGTTVSTASNAASSAAASSAMAGGAGYGGESLLATGGGAFSPGFATVSGPSTAAAIQNNYYIDAIDVASFQERLAREGELVSGMVVAESQRRPSVSGGLRSR